MSDDLSQLDELIESDVLEALGVPVPEELKQKEAQEMASNNIEESLDIDDIGLDELDNGIESDICENIPDVPSSGIEEIDPENFDLDIEVEEVSLPELEDDVEVPVEEIDEDEASIPDLGDIEILPFADDEPEELDIENELQEEDNSASVDSTISNDNTVTMTSNDLGSLADILSKLLNNKTIEITIKIKD